MTTLEVTNREPVERTYGDYQPPPRAGLFGISLAGTLVGAVGVMLTLLGMLVIRSLIFTAAALLLTVVVMVPLVVRVKGEALLTRAAAALVTRCGVRRRENVYAAGPLGVIPGGTHRLPGLLTSTDAYEFQAGGRRFALLWHRQADHWSIVIGCHPAGRDLVEEIVLERRVSAHGAFLKSFAPDRDLAGIQQTIELVPDPGGRVRDAIMRQISADAPAAAAEAMNIMARSMSEAGQTWVTSKTAITWRTPTSITRRKKAEQPELMANWVAARLNPICAALFDAGAGVARPMHVVDLAEDMRLAYDPAAAHDIDEQRLAGVEHRTSRWEDCGPARMVERNDDLLHDSGRSVSWSMASAPSGEVDREALVPLLTVEPEVARKRVCLTFRPEPPDKARGRVKRSIRATSFKSSQDRIGDDAYGVDMDVHRSTQRELRRGAALINFTAHVTVTTSGEVDQDTLRGIVESVESTGRAADLPLRRCWRHQQVGFSAALGVGVLPGQLSQLPRMVREAL
jgi:hypothetical protein